MRPLKNTRFFLALRLPMEIEACVSSVIAELQNNEESVSV